MKYIDTSAFVKYYGEEGFEKGSNKITRLIEDVMLSKETLVSSIFMLGETISVFDRWVRIKAITPQEFSKLVSRFLFDVKRLNDTGGLIIETINPLVIMFSIDFVIKHHIPINDAIHLYTALIYKPDIDGFLCSDKNLCNAAKNENLEVINPEK